jgi:hypothetical protein
MFVHYPGYNAKISAIIFSFLQTLAILMAIWGYYTCRPSMIYPIFLCIYIDMLFLLIFIADCLSSADLQYRSRTEVILGLCLIAAYAIWLCITVIACQQVRTTYGEFMFWDEVERSTPSPATFAMEADADSRRRTPSLVSGSFRQKLSVTLEMGTIYAQIANV